jgi:hypothetical protein
MSALSSNSLQPTNNSPAAVATVNSASHEDLQVIEAARQMIREVAAAKESAKTFLEPSRVSTEMTPNQLQVSQTIATNITVPGAERSAATVQVLDLQNKTLLKLWPSMKLLLLYLIKKEIDRVQNPSLQQSILGDIQNCEKVYTRVDQYNPSSAKEILNVLKDREIGVFLSKITDMYPNLNIVPDELVKLFPTLKELYSSINPSIGNVISKPAQAQTIQSAEVQAAGAAAVQNLQEAAANCQAEPATANGDPFTPSPEAARAGRELLLKHIRQDIENLNELFKRVVSDKSLSVEEIQKFLPNLPGYKRSDVAALTLNLQAAQTIGEAAESKEPFAVSLKSARISKELFLNAIHEEIYRLEKQRTRIENHYQFLAEDV